MAEQFEEKLTFDGKKVKVLGPTFEEGIVTRKAAPPDESKTSMPSRYSIPLTTTCVWFFSKSFSLLLNSAPLSESDRKSTLLGSRL